MSERHFPDSNVGPTFACMLGIQYYHLKFGDRYYFEHGGQSGSFTPRKLPILFYLRLYSSMISFNIYINDLTILLLNNNIEQLDNIRGTTSMARWLCNTAFLDAVQRYAFFPPSRFNPPIDCSTYPEIDYSLWADNRGPRIPRAQMNQTIKTNI